jgi:hypothetical protein
MQQRNTIRIPLASITAALLLASCGLGGEANLGDDAAALHGESGPSDYDPCAAAACGDSCTLCDPSDADCVETHDSKYCDRNGTCKAEVPKCAAGEACGSVTCDAGEVCCNESCGVCTPPGGACTQQLCNSEGNGNSEDPCAGKTCGEECSLCQPGVPCLTKLTFCDARGVCDGGVACNDVPEYDPCEAKNCGDACSLCAPDDRDCAGPLIASACDARGACTYQVPSCSSEEGCTVGETRVDDCNTCDCVEGVGWVCTDIACGDSGTPCRAAMGETCAEGEYCAHQPGDDCGASGATAVCEARPEACDLQYTPVCGCDGQTYGNACVAALEGVGVRTEGECE